LGSKIDPKVIQPAVGGKTAKRINTMLSYTQVVELSDEATERAEELGLEPLDIHGFDPVAPLKFIRRIPFLGTYCPAGWTHPELIEDLFVDSTGLDESGPALSVSAFVQILAGYAAAGTTYGFGIIESGEFQVYIRVYTRTDEIAAEYHAVAARY
jgi:hypothetical protein